MICRRIEALIDDYLDGALETRAADDVERHVAECPDCQRLLARSRAVIDAMTRLPVEAAASGFFDAALRKAEIAPLRRKRRSAPSRWYLGAIAAGLTAVVAVGLMADRIEAPSLASGMPQVALAVEEARTINLVFASDEALDAVSLSVDLPQGVELASYPGQKRVQWSTQLHAGKNVLPLELVAYGGTGGELIATMRRDGKEKVFRVRIAVEMG